MASTRRSQGRGALVNDTYPREKQPIALGFREQQPSKPGSTEAGRTSP
jgi:hypothetical protein